jgi:hypothetical protein
MHLPYKELCLDIDRTVSLGDKSTLSVDGLLDAALVVDISEMFSIHFVPSVLPRHFNNRLTTYSTSYASRTFLRYHGRD